MQLTGFLEKETGSFCRELWKMCLSAQASPQGVPKELLEAKKKELLEKVHPFSTRILLVRYAGPGLTLRRTKLPRTLADVERSLNVEIEKREISATANAANVSVDGATPGGAGELVVGGADLDLLRDTAITTTGERIHPWETGTSRAAVVGVDARPDAGTRALDPTRRRGHAQNPEARHLSVAGDPATGLEALVLAVSLEVVLQALFEMQRREPGPLDLAEAARLHVPHLSRVLVHLAAHDRDRGLEVAKVALRRPSGDATLRPEAPRLRADDDTL
jgi:hypothetical protein